ncbi:MAG TPA: hypothetical protein VNH64_06815 [Parvularculaceae bacterium]|nr:hypothetical protein [Parvularculaceae bacterium]
MAGGASPTSSPTRAIEWAVHTKVNPPKTLVDAVEAQGHTLIDCRRRCEELERQLHTIASAEKELGERERTTLLKMIIGMAIKGYTYDPKVERSAIPREIAEDIQSLKFDISTQTVPEKLAAARELLPSDFGAIDDSQAN